MITKSEAVVYHGGGRRYLTLMGACRGEANRKLRVWHEVQGEDWREADSTWWNIRATRLARLYRARYRRLQAVA